MEASNPVLDSAENPFTLNTDDKKGTEPMHLRSCGVLALGEQCMGTGCTFKQTANPYLVNPHAFVNQKTNIPDDVGNTSIFQIGTHNVAWFYCKNCFVEGREEIARYFAHNDNKMPEWIDVGCSIS